MRLNKYLDEAPLEGGNGSAEPIVQEPINTGGDNVDIEGQPLETAAPEVKPEAGGVSTPPVSSPGTGLSKEDIAEIARNVGGGIVSGLQKNQPPATISPEEFNKRFNVASFNEEFVQKLLSPETTGAEKVALINQLRDGVAKQAVTMARYLMEANHEEFVKQLNPVVTEYQRQVDERLEKNFFEANPDLKGFRAIAVNVKDKLLANGVRFSSEKEAFAAVADQVRLVLKDIGVNKGSLPASKSTVTPTKGMPVLSGSGHGGGKGGGGAEPDNNVKSIWDN